MARRRKVGGRRKAGSRARKSVDEEQPTPTPTTTATTATPTATTTTSLESEESSCPCPSPSPGKQQDTSSSNASLPAEPAEPPEQQQQQTTLHKKFGKFRCLMDKDYHLESVADTSSAACLEVAAAAATPGEENDPQIPMDVDPPVPAAPPVIQQTADVADITEKQPEIAAPVIVTQTEQVILESEPVWGEEIIEETVVCEAIGNLEIDPSTDNSQSVESKDSDSLDCQLKVVEPIEIMKSSESKDSINSNEEKEEKPLPVLEPETITQFADMNLVKESADGNGGSADSSDVNESSDGSNKIRRSSRIRSIGIMKKTREVRDPIKPPVVAAAPPVVEEDKDSTGGSENVASVSPALESDALKPVKVKSRWRRSSELELCGGNRESDSENNATSQSATSSPTSLTKPEPIQVLDLNDERLRQFEIIQENEYHTERQTSKEAKRMLCDCFLTKEEVTRGELGCGEDCLNRLLMIECGSRCSLGDLCSNKHFQRHENSRCQVVKTEKKGYGLQVMEDLPAGAFIMEYVGEVLDPREFRRRAKEYARDKNQHYYFMALKSDTIIDATSRGSISRFINHSCDPNSETQKWTVNGELRIGFFTKTAVRAGDEITFDYQLQRYGKDAQRCFCEATNCRGWIGEDPGKEKAVVPLSAVITPAIASSVKKSSSSSKKKETPKTKDFLDDMDLEEEISKLCISGLKNRAHTLTLCRLMVRASDSTSRLRILQLLREGDTACRRLFLDYHGLRLLWSWMVDDSEAELRPNLLEALAALPIPNKTMLQDSKVLTVVEKWAIPEARPTPIVTEDSNGENSVASTTSSDPPATVAAAAALLAEWSSLKETFRIPKRERIEQMKEHEREADRGYNEYLDTKQSYGNSWRQIRRIDSIDSSAQGKKILEASTDTPGSKSAKIK